MGCLYSEPKSVIIIGNRVGVSPSCIWIKEKLEIGSNVMIGANCLIMDNDAHQIDYEARFHGKKANPLEPTTIVQHAPIIIEDDVWIGANCQILKGVTIGARTIIGAGSVVTRNIPADCIAAGNPCRIIRRNG
jgi:acetyltransferase-like isoleucine patch superfamily enzyme